MKINLNDSCSVILTEAGAAELNRQSQEFVDRNGLRHLCHKHYAGERHRVQMWILFEEFGASMGLTAPTMFEGLDIEVEGYTK